MGRSAEFGDATGHHYVEHDMPESTAYKHPIRSYGEPRRLSVYDPADPTPRSASPHGHIADDPKGEPGLIGYSDFYREPPTEHSYTSVRKDEAGNETRERITNTIADTNVGFMTVHDKYRGGGVGRQMFDYMHKTTPEGSVLNVGKVAHAATEHMAKKLREEKPDSIRYKFF